MPRVAPAAPPLDALLREMAADIEAATGLDRVDTSPLWVPNRPQPGRGITLPDGRVLSPQQLALESPADELAFGGGPGGGKSDLMLGVAVTRHKASAIFRRQYAQFKGPKGLIARSLEIIGLRGHQAQNTWRDLPGGRALEFLGCDFEKDVLKYIGRPHDFKAFDEATEFPEKYYRTLIGWLRTETPGQRTRVIVTFNPPQTEEGQWVIRYWAPWLDKAHPDPAQPGELRWYVVGADGKDLEVPGPKWGPGRAPAVPVGFLEDGVTPRLINPRSRTFIPSQVEDNPYYMATGYADQLDALPEPLRTMMRTGNFQPALGDHRDQLIPTAWVVEAQRRWRPDGGAGVPLSAAGADCSRDGKDEFVIALRHDDWVAPLVVHPASAAPTGLAGAQLILRALGPENGAVPVAIDADGVGVSVYDYARSLGLNATALHGGMKSKARTRKVPRPGADAADLRGTFPFANKRAEWHWRLREALDPVFGATLALPPDPQLRADLCAVRWSLELGGIRIEPKEDVQARLGRSPDRGEAAMYACVRETRVPQGLLFDASAVPVGDLEAEVARLKRELGLSDGNGRGNGGPP